MLTDREKRELAMASTWPVDVAAEYFDISPSHLRGLNGSNDASDMDRFEIEKWLAREDFIGLDWLALEFGIPRDAMEQAMRAPPSVAGIAPFPLDAYCANDRFLLPRRLAEAWVKALLPKHKVWSSLDSRAHDLAARLDGRVRECAVSRRFNDNPPAVATCRCIVTWDDVSRMHQEYLENRKPLSLEPDHVGWHAIYDRKVALSDLWRTDMANLQNYLEKHGVAWLAA